MLINIQVMKKKIKIYVIPVMTDGKNFNHKEEKKKEHGHEHGKKIENKNKVNKPNKK